MRPFAGFGQRAIEMVCDMTRTRMNRTRTKQPGAVWSTLVVILVAGACPSPTDAEPPPSMPADEKASAELIALLGDGFRIKETDHCTLAYDASSEVMRALVGRLEGTFRSVWRFCEGNGIAVHPPAARLQVILFDDYEDFVVYGRRLGADASALAGFYHHATNRAIFANMLNRPEFAQLNQAIEDVSAQLQTRSRRRSGKSGPRVDRRGLTRRLTSLRARRDAMVARFNRMIVQHEAAHQVLFNIGVHARRAQTPDWLTEGLACQFEVAQTRSTKRLGRTNHARLGDFREFLCVVGRASKAEPEQFAAAVADGKWLPLDKLISEARSVSNGGTHAIARYAQAWSLVFFLQRKYPEKLAAYISLIATRPPGKRFGADRERKDFASIFGPPDRDLEKEWVDFILGLRYDRKAAGR